MQDDKYKAYAVELSPQRNYEREGSEIVNGISRHWKRKEVCTAMKQLFARHHALRALYHDYIYWMVVAFLCLSHAMPVQAQQAIKTGAGIINPETVTESEVGFKFGSVIVAPIPFSSPLIGSGVTLGAGYLFNFPGSKPSGFGVAKLRSSNGSTGIGGGASINFGQGKWNVFVLAAQADVFYDLPVSGDLDLPLNQDGELASFTVRRAISEKLSFGLQLSYLDTDIRIDNDFLSLLPPVLQPDLDISLGKLHFLVEYDSRDNTFYPTQGYRADLDLSYNQEIDSAFGNRFNLASKSYLKFLASGSVYHELPNASVIAARSVFCAAGEDAPFFDTCGLGLADGVRGFPALSFLGNYSASIQAEYRGRFNERFGYVAFIGGGGTNDDVGDVLSDISVAGGVGLRVRLSKKFALDYAVDYALNDDGEHFLYLSLGQKF